MSASRILRPPASAEACANCRAWRPWGDIGVCQETSAGYVELGRKPLGQCRARPPVIDPDAVSSNTATWPVVSADDWCVEFDRRAAALQQGRAA